MKKKQSLFAFLCLLSASFTMQADLYKAHVLQRASQMLLGHIQRNSYNHNFTLSKIVDLKNKYNIQPQMDSASKALLNNCTEINDLNNKINVNLIKKHELNYPSFLVSLRRKLFESRYDAQQRVTEEKVANIILQNENRFFEREIQRLEVTQQPHSSIFKFLSTVEKNLNDAMTFIRVERNLKK